MQPGVAPHRAEPEHDATNPPALAVNGVWLEKIKKKARVSKSLALIAAIKDQTKVMATPIQTPPNTAAFLRGRTLPTNKP